MMRSICVRWASSRPKSPLGPRPLSIGAPPALQSAAASAQEVACACILANVRNSMAVVLYCSLLAKVMRLV